MLRERVRALAVTVRVTGMATVGGPELSMVGGSLMLCCNRQAFPAPHGAASPGVHFCPQHPSEAECVRVKAGVSHLEEKGSFP